MEAVHGPGREMCINRRFLLVALCCAAMNLTGCESPSGRKSEDVGSVQTLEASAPIYTIWITNERGNVGIDLSPEESFFLSEQYQTIADMYATTTGRVHRKGRIEEPIAMIMEKQSEHAEKGLSARFIGANFRYWVTKDLLPADFLDEVDFSNEFEMRFAGIMKKHFRYITNAGAPTE